MNTIKERQTQITQVWTFEKTTTRDLAIYRYV